MKKVFSILCLILCFSFSVNLVWADNNSAESSNGSIKDFSSLLKKTNKDKVGDSYYKWCMDLPKDLKISYRNFDGTHNYFEADDGEYGISLLIKDNENDTIDSLMAEELEYASEYTILNQSKENKNG